jgi:hypothetical protein
VVSRPATDEEHDGAEEESESRPVVGTSRPPGSPGPIPRSRAAQLLIEVPPCSAVGMSLHRAHLPPRASRTRRYGVSVCERGHVSPVGSRPECRTPDNSASQCIRPRLKAGLCAQPAWRAYLGLEGKKTLREVKIAPRTRLDAWNMAHSGGRRGEAATPYPIFGAPHHRVTGA